MYLYQHLLVFFDVLKYIKSANGIKFLSERNISRVHLHEIDCRLPVSSYIQPGTKYLTPVKLCAGISLSYARQYIPSTTTYFEKRTKVGTMLFPQRPNNQSVTSTEPEMPCFETGQVRKVVSLKSAPLARKSRGI